MKYGTISLTRKINRHLTPSRGVFVLALDVEKQHIEITIEPEKFGSMLLDEDYAVECQVEMKPQDWTGVPLARNRYDDGPGDVSSEDCAKLEGICNETPESRPLGPPTVSSQSNIDIAQAKIQQAKEHNSYRPLIEQALAVCVMRGASSAMSQDVARAILWLDRQPLPGAEGGFRCKQCGTVFLASAKDKEGRPCVRGGHAICPECACAWPVDDAAPVEKRCGTCDNWNLGDKTKNGLRPCVHGFGYFKSYGPPWDNCRFWERKGAKP